MQYAASSSWTVHNFIPTSWGLVGDTDPAGYDVPGQNYNWGALPGAAGLGYATFDECVAANLLSASRELDLPGGKMGVILQDASRSDNVPGLDGRSPTWCLRRL